MNLSEYLKPVGQMLAQPEQQAWFAKFERKARQGEALYNAADGFGRQYIRELLQTRIRTEELKAWYGEPENGSLFQGTSVTSLTIPHILEQPLPVNSVLQLEEILADAYIARHREHVETVRNAIQEDTSEWTRRGLYYGVVICSKLLSQAFGLTIASEDVIFDVKGLTVDPHEITSYPAEVREAYFEKCLERIECFQGVPMGRRDLESSLALADISKPKIAAYKDKIMLGPVLCNELAALLSVRVSALIREKSAGEIAPDGLAVVIYDTDTPYTYHSIMGFTERNLSPVLPGLVVLGASGTADAFRWLYAYRTSLLAQKIQKGSLYSQVHGRFIPFVFFGVLVWRDAQILLDMDNLHRLRYRGNIQPGLEFAYQIPDLAGSGLPESVELDWDAFSNLHRPGDKG